MWLSRQGPNLLHLPTLQVGRCSLETRKHNPKEESSVGPGKTKFCKFKNDLVLQGNFSPSHICWMVLEDNERHKLLGTFLTLTLNNNHIYILNERHNM